jgi:5-oxopent-3-ene-1,2,5-tricarboxylate decarboxylase / 2-hydroxyhepta-2,4-diene-1,7-dioate isomerase
LTLASENAVYGVALNFTAELERLKPQLHADPYKKPPVAPILYLKPRNTWTAHGSVIPLPAGVEQIKMAGTLGVWIGRTACKVTVKGALDYVGGYTVVNDVSIPHESYYRPAIRERCRDGFCAIGPAMARLRDPGRVEIRISLNNEVVCMARTSDLVRSVPRLIAEITEFMTLRRGDLLLVGEPPDAPLARAGDRVRVEIGGLPFLENRVSLEGRR